MMALTTNFAEKTRMLSTRKWGTKREVTLVGTSQAFSEAQQRLRQFADIDNHLLLMGESGAGKELFARALYLHCSRSEEAFISVNCAQYQSGDLLVSELFGHRKGSFTGATEDRVGVFKAANHGVVFLDEVGELSPQAQAMLLRTLSNGEVKRVGDSKVDYTDVRVIAATNRRLDDMIADGTFREDLFYRLRTLHVHIPPLRRRGDDVRHLVYYFLKRINRERSQKKRFSNDAWDVLLTHDWPGNAREVRSVVRMSHCICQADTITADHLRTVMDFPGGGAGAVRKRKSFIERTHYREMTENGTDFWTAVRKPFMDRELNRRQVRAIVKRGLNESGGSYKKLLRIFHVQDGDYLKFMDFLRHHRLKPLKAKKGGATSSDTQRALS